MWDSPKFTRGPYAIHDMTTEVKWGIYTSFSKRSIHHPTSHPNLILFAHSTGWNPLTLTPRRNTNYIHIKMNSTTPTPIDLEAMAKMYYSDKISLALGSQFMAYVPFLLFYLLPLPTSFYPFFLYRLSQEYVLTTKGHLGCCLYRNLVWSNTQMDPLCFQRRTSYQAPGGTSPSSIDVSQRTDQQGFALLGCLAATI
jgi:hypothetical protein